jgi:hypothetical protein
VIRIREHEGRSLDMQLNDDLSTALMRLMDQALVAAEWWPAAPAQPTSPTEPATREPLN